MRFVDQFDDEAFNDPEKDIPNRRIYYLGNGREIKLERRDPYGFVFIIWDKGQTPNAISGSYTDFDQARRALEVYVNSETREELSEEPTTKVEPIKYKKAYRKETMAQNA
jgi:hypothetical protein